MTAQDLSKDLAAITRWEGRVSWPYLDNAEFPNVTIGIGCLVASVDEMRALPLRRVADGQLATAAEVGAEFVRLRLMVGGQRAAAYRGRYYLAEADIDEIAIERLRRLVAGMPAVFPAWDDLPAPAQACLLDLGWNCGLGQRPGLLGWTHLREALASSPPDWSLAAENCTTANPKKLAKRAARNAWRVDCLRAAAEGRSTPVPL